MKPTLDIMKKNKLIAITTGDHKGIGLEVTIKALLKAKYADDYCFVLYTSKKNQTELIPLLKKKYILTIFSSEDEFLESLKYPSITVIKKARIFIILSSKRPSSWVASAAQLCLKNIYCGMVTAPMSKQESFKLGYGDLGHTDILRRISGVKDLFMFFRGEKFSTLLVSGHIPIDKINSSIFKHIKAACSEAIKISSFFDDARPIAVLGINPHAGDRGLIGHSDLKLAEIIKKVPSSRRFSPPLVPDVAFQKQYWQKYSLYMAMFHDQGLIPFKMAHGFKATHITLGLPFIRTSVDHGTGFDIYGKNIADPSSMIYAIKSCIQLSKKRG